MHDIGLFLPGTENLEKKESSWLGYRYLGGCGSFLLVTHTPSGLGEGREDRVRVSKHWRTKRPGADGGEVIMADVRR